MYSYFPSLPDDKLMNLSKFKAFPDDAEDMDIVGERVENLVGKGENADSGIFSFSHKVF